MTLLRRYVSHFYRLLYMLNATAIRARIFVSDFGGRYSGVYGRFIREF